MILVETNAKLSRLESLDVWKLETNSDTRKLIMIVLKAINEVVEDPTNKNYNILYAYYILILWCSLKLLNT